MIPAKNHRQILDSIVEDLKAVQGGSRKRSWNVVIPPCFRGDLVAFELEKRIRSELEVARVALVSADGIESPKDLIKQISIAWNVVQEDDVEQETAANHMLSKLLDTLGGGVNVLILREFRKILSAMDERILVALRDAEQAGRLHTVVVSIYPHKWLKELWKLGGNALRVSNYGDQHKLMVAETPSLDDILEIVDREVYPTALVRLAFLLTGGYPEVLEAVLEEYVDDGAPQLRPDYQSRLASVAKREMHPLCRHVDIDGSERYHDLLARIHNHIAEPGDLRMIERSHPWSSLLLDGTGLRADSLGEALADMKFERAFKAGDLTVTVEYAQQMVEENYTNRQYDLALRAADNLMQHCPSPELDLVRCNASIMDALRGSISETGLPDVDSDWARVLQFIAEARTVLTQVFGETDQAIHLSERYEDLENFAKAVMKARKSENTRLLDRLGGLQGADADREMAYKLMVFQLESARGLRGNGFACKAILALPEQMIRIFGWWSHETNYYKAPEISEDVWTRVLEIWPPNMSRPHKPERGTEFASLMLYLYVLYGRDSVGESGNPTWPNVDVFRADLGFIQKRNDMSHATVHISSKRRDEVFDYADRWLKRIEFSCLEDLELSRPKVLGLVDPLLNPQLRGRTTNF